MSRPQHTPQSGILRYKTIALFIVLAFAGYIIALPSPTPHGESSTATNTPTSTNTNTPIFFTQTPIDTRTPTWTITATPVGTYSPTSTATATFTPTPMTQCTPGNLDSSFNNFGYLTTSIRAGANGTAAALQPDGKIVVAGSSYSDSSSSLALARYNNDGTLDLSFNGTGILVMPDSLNLNGAAAVAVQPDGKIVIAGSGWAIVRLNSDGSLDTTFNGTGIVRTILAPGYATSHALALMTDGRIVVAGDYYDGSSPHFMAARYSSNGGLDTTFNGTGYVTTSYYGAETNGVAVQPDGKIVLAGQADTIFAALRYTATGSLDTTFGGTGIVTTIVGPNFDVARAVALQPDGKVVVAGESFRGQTTSYDFAVLRYNPDGMLDTSFSGDGIAITAVGQFNDQAYAVVIQPDGKIVLGGHTDSWLGYTKSFGIVRYLPNGSLEPTFGSNGRATTLIETIDELYSVLIQPDGKIVAAGNSYGWDGEDYNYHFAVARYWGNRCAADTPTSTATASPTPTFTATSTATAAGTPTLGNYADASLLLSGNIIVTPDAAPIDTLHLNVSTSTDFKGYLYGDPATGVLRVVDAHPAGTYTLTVKAFSNSALTTTKTFQLNVTTPANVSAPVSFRTPMNFPVGDSPYDVAIGDFNGDARQDLVAVNQWSSNVTLLKGNSGGTFSTTGTAAVGQIPFWGVTGDFNNDGKADVIVSNDQTASLSVLLGDGTGHLGAATNITLGWRYPGDLAVGDFNSDGKQDFAMDEGLGISIFLGNGAGGFSVAGSSAAGFAPGPLAISDFNEDGKPDVVTIDEDAHTAYILLGDGAGHLGSATGFPTLNSASGIAVGEFNGDNHQDLAVTSFDTSSVTILLGNGQGSFSVGAAFAGGFQPRELAVGDFDADGKQDLAINEYFGGVAILLGDGTGNFAAPTVVNTDGGSEGLVVGDFNGDGKQDLAVGDFGSNRVDVVLRNCAPTPTPTATLTPTITPTTDPDLTPTPSLTSTATPTNTASGFPSRTPTNTATKTPTFTPTPSPEFDLTISQSAPRVSAGGIDYTLTVMNSPTGVGGVACPTVRFGYPTGLPVVFAFASGTDGFIGTADGGGVTFTGGCISSQNGQRASATLRVFITITGFGTVTSPGSNVVVDPGNAVPETDENNNIAETIFTLIIFDTQTPTSTNTPTASPTSTSTPIIPPGNCDESFDFTDAPALPFNWSSTETGAGVPWVTSTMMPDFGRNDVFAPDPNRVGNTELVFSREDVYVLPGNPFSFRNSYDLESTYDGMVLEISVNDGPFQDIIAAGGSFITGGYNGIINTSFMSPIAGRAAWTGNSGGYITTTVRLPPSAFRYKLKWRVATDTSVAGTGVRIDSINGLQCGDATPTSTPTPTATATATSTATNTATPRPTGTGQPPYYNHAPICTTFGSAADLYPSINTAEGLPLEGRRPRVVLHRVTHQAPDNLDVLLVGPQGQKFLLMADAGGSAAIGPPGVDLTFGDNSNQVLPDAMAPLTGFYEPTSWEPGQTSFPAPAPAAPYNEPGSALGGTTSQTLAGIFGGSNLNGVWRLYVRDDGGLFGTGTTGCIEDGWELQFLPVITASVSGRVTTADGQGIRNAKVVVTGNSLTEPVVATTGSFGYFTFEGLRTEETYVVSVNSRRYMFSTPNRVIMLADNVADVDFVADP